MKRTILFLTGMLLAGARPVPAAGPTGAEIMKMADEAPDGDNGKSHANMLLVDKDGDTRDREFTVMRLDDADGTSKYFIEFIKPADVKGMKFMVWDYTGKPDDRWMYLPRMRMVRRIAADDERGAFVGSDFTYEDISGRDPNKDTHTLVGEDELNGRKVWVVESTPKGPGDEFARKKAWVDQQNHLILKEEYYDAAGEPILRYTVEKVETIQDIPTTTLRKMENLKSGHYTTLEFGDIQYNLPDMDEDQFTVRALKR